MRQSAIGTYCVGRTYYDGVFLCTLIFYLTAQGGGGVKPPKPPPPPVDPPLVATSGLTPCCSIHCIEQTCGLGLLKRR